MAKACVGCNLFVTFWTKSSERFEGIAHQMRYTIVGGLISGTPVGSQYGQRDRYATTIDLSSLIYRILDREDEAGRDINEFAKTLPNYLDSPEIYRYHFHCVNVYQSGFTDNQSDVDNFMEYIPTIS